MTERQVKEVISLYKGAIAGCGYTVQHHENPEGKAQNLQHALWLLNEMSEMDELTGDNVSRLLGFVQGVLNCYRIFTINEMREHNR